MCLTNLHKDIQQQALLSLISNDVFQLKGRKFSLRTRSLGDATSVWHPKLCQ